MILLEVVRTMRYAPAAYINANLGLPECLLQRNNNARSCLQCLLKGMNHVTCGSVNKQVLDSLGLHICTILICWLEA